MTPNEKSYITQSHRLSGLGIWSVYSHSSKRKNIQHVTAEGGEEGRTSKWALGPGILSRPCKKQPDLLYSCREQGACGKLHSLWATFSLGLPSLSPWTSLSIWTPAQSTQGTPELFLTPCSRLPLPPLLSGAPQTENSWYISGLRRGPPPRRAARESRLRVALR